MTLRDAYFQSVSQSEGYCEGLCLCTEGRMTIGYGRNLEAHPLTRGDVEALRGFSKQGVKEPAKAMYEAWCRSQISKTEAQLGAWFGWFSGLPDFAKVVLVDMTYNLNGKTKDFQKMLWALEHGDFDRAADELRDSDFYRQTGHRGRRMEAMLRERGEPFPQKSPP